MSDFEPLDANVMIRRAMAGMEVTVLAIPLDFDRQHSPATRAERLPFDPHVEVETSPGNFQSWLYLDRPYSLAEVEAVAAALGAKVGVDATASGEHGYRVPGTFNYPNKKKIAAGRPPEPVMARITDIADPDWQLTSISLDDLKATIISKYPGATFDAQTKKAEADKDFDWDQRWPVPLVPMTDAQIIETALDQTHASDRSAGAWAVFCAALRRGHSPAEVLAMALDHINVGCFAKYAEKSDPEGELRKQIKKAFIEEKPAPASETFDGTNLGTTPSTEQTIQFPDIYYSTGFSKATPENTRIAILALGLECGYDRFHDKLLIGGHQLVQWAGEVSDYACLYLRPVIRKEFKFEPTTKMMEDTIKQLCLQNQFDPVCDYLNGLKWDGIERLDTWMTDYLGAPDTPLIRAFSRISLTAAVRRARQPGCKFDQMIVLEGPEGKNKSTAIETLAGADNFSDQHILGVDDKTQQELIKGTGLYEAADLTGIRKADADKIKAFLSRRIDRSRPVYGHFRVDQPRRGILFGTTNATSGYLQSLDGNRRWWTVKTGEIDIVRLKADRDQLWAEAAQSEANGASIVLPEELWDAAKVEQDARLEHDPWKDLLADVHGLVVLADHGGYEERVTTADLLLQHLKLSADRIRPSTGKQLKHIMVQLGWDHRRRSRSTARRSRATAGSLKDLHLATRTPSRGILRYPSSHHAKRARDHRFRDMRNYDLRRLFALIFAYPLLKPPMLSF